jgi:MFS family permease
VEPLSTRDSVAQRASATAEFIAGWRALIAAFLGIACGAAGLYYYTLGVMMKPMQVEFGWSRAGLSSVLLIAAIVSALIAPLVGTLADRLGVWRVAGVSTIGLAAGFWLYSSVSGGLTNFLILNALLAIVAAGSSPVVLSRLVVVWFDKARGLALGIALAGTGVTGALAPRLLSRYVADHGWRAGYQALALVALLAAPLIMALAYERSSGVTERSAVRADRYASGAGLMLREALSSARFWHIAALFSCVALGVGGLIVHMIPLLTDAGLSPERAGGIAGLIGISLIIGRIATGALIDRIFAPRVAAVLFAMAALGCFALEWGGVTLAPFAAISLGLAIGAEIDLVGYLVAKYFGLKAYGAIYGWQYSAFMLGVALSPFIAGLIFDHTGSYRYVVLGAGTLLAIAALIAMCLGAFPTIEMERNVLPER